MLNTYKSVALTGSTGFIGESLLRQLYSEGYGVRSLGRREPATDVAYAHPEHRFLELGSSEFSIVDFLESVDVFIHSAARTHVMGESLSNPLSAYLKFNTEATLRLASQAAAAGVKRFIYLSSVKALGESTTDSVPYSFDSPMQPEDDYGISKTRAEIGLREIGQQTGMEVTIIRPPLVYGPGVKANFASMMRIAERNLPLPFASVQNKRSLVALDNLVDLIVTCVSHPAAGNQTFMVSDDADVSTPELLSAMTRAYGKKPRLLPFPPALMVTAASLLGKRTIADRLLGSLQVDITHTKDVLGWTPPVKLENVLKEIVNDSDV